LKTYTNRSRVSEDPGFPGMARVHYVHPNITIDLDLPRLRGPAHFKSIDDFQGKLHDANGIWPSSDTVQSSFDCRDLKTLQPWVQDENFSGNASVTPISPIEIPIPNSVVFNFPVASDDLWQVFAEDAFTSFSTQIPTEVSIANFTWELRELGDLIPKLTDSLQGTLAGGFLNFSFGWKPFVGDLQKLSGLLTTVSARIQHLKDTYGKKTRLGLVRTNVVETAFLPYSDVVPDARFQSVFYHWELVAYRCDFRAGGRLFHRLKDLDSVYGYIRAITVALGLDNPLRAAWQALPFSFVVDWFLGLSRVLGKLSVNPFKGDWSVSNFSSSCYTVATWKVTQVVINPYVEIPLGKVYADRYTRISRLPVPASFLTLGTLSPQQLLLTSAMLA